MIRTPISATTLALLGTLQAHADQYAVRINVAFDGATPELLQALRIEEIDNFKVHGNQYVILEAPCEAYVEAYVFAIGRKAVELSTLDADWTHPSVAEMPLENRLRFLRQVECEYCVS